MSCPCGGFHPALQRPVTAKQVADELASLWWIARRTGAVTFPEPRLEFEARLSRVHRRNARRYAECNIGTRVVYLAGEFLWLSKRHRIGVLAHEIGHLILGIKGTERQADEIARDALGVEIAYDLRFPGRGLQYESP